MDKDKQASMIALVNDWKQSGMSIKTYANNAGISKAKFGYWVRKEKADSITKQQYPQFIEVGSMAENLHLCKDAAPQIVIHAKPQIELTFPSGLCLKIYG